VLIITLIAFTFTEASRRRLIDAVAVKRMDQVR